MPCLGDSTAILGKSVPDVFLCMLSGCTSLSPNQRTDSEDRLIAPLSFMCHYASWFLRSPNVSHYLLMDTKGVTLIFETC